MDYQEAIEILACELGYVDLDTANRGYVEEQEQKFMDACKSAISAMHEMQEYKKLGTLEEIQEAMERQQECRNCGYKIHSDGISKLNSCNDCGLSNTCEKRPDYGKYCRINCYDWSEKK